MAFLGLWATSGAFRRLSIVKIESEINEIEMAAFRSVFKI